jgi:hypothetical protein
MAGADRPGPIARRSSRAETTISPFRLKLQTGYSRALMYAKGFAAERGIELVSLAEASDP